MLTELLAEMDSLIAKVIGDANIRGASIAGYRVLPNGKVVIYTEASLQRLPQYFGTRFCAIDSLIHRYNLKKHYRYLYERRRGTPEVPLSKASDNRPESTFSMEKEAISRCDSILWHYNRYELLGPDRHSIYSALGSMQPHATLRRTMFNTIKNTLIRHYRRKADEAFQVSDRVKLKKIVRFFSDMEYHDLI
jgi:hypothetical protein